MDHRGGLHHPIKTRFQRQLINLYDDAGHPCGASHPMIRYITS